MHPFASGERIHYDRAFVARAPQGSPAVTFAELATRLRAGAAIGGERARA